MNRRELFRRTISVMAIAATLKFTTVVAETVYKSVPITKAIEKYLEAHNESLVRTGVALTKMIPDLYGNIETTRIELRDFYK